MKKKILYLLGGILMFLSVFGIIGGSYVNAAGEDDDQGKNGEMKNDGNGATSSEIGINFGNGCLTGVGTSCFKMDYLIWGKDTTIARRNDSRTVLTVAQDIVLAATYGVGTVLTIILIYCGLRYILASSSGKDPSDYRRGLIRAGIGALLVRSAYAIVRLIQYIAKG